MTESVTITPGDSFRSTLNLNGWVEGNSRDSLSERLEIVLGRYAHLIKHSEPKLSETEWQFISEALQSTWFAHPGSAHSIPENLISVCDETGIDEVYGIDAAKLAQKLKSISATELMAIVERIEAKNGPL